MNASKLVSIAALTTACLGVGKAYASPVLMDFEGGLPSTVTTNVVLNRFRVSPI
jgi:hypothetical protein